MTDLSTSLGWRSGNLLPALGHDGVDFSFGRQLVTVDGFLITDDGFNPGNAFSPIEGVRDGRFDRGGAFYLGQRLAFGNTAMLKLGGKEGLHGSLIWLKSENPGQSKTELAVGTLDYTTPIGSIGSTYIHGLDVDEKYAFADRLERKGMNVYSIHGQGNAGIENADFAFEVARQENVPAHSGQCSSTPATPSPMCNGSRRSVIAIRAIPKAGISCSRAVFANASRVKSQPTTLVR